MVFRLPVRRPAWELFEVSLAGVLEILGWDFSRGPEVLCELVGAGTGIVVNWG